MNITTIAPLATLPNLKELRIQFLCGQRFHRYQQFSCLRKSGGLWAEYRKK